MEHTQPCEIINPPAATSIVVHLEYHRSDIYKYRISLGRDWGGGGIDKPLKACRLLQTNICEFSWSVQVAEQAPSPPSMRFQLRLHL